MKKALELRQKRQQLIADMGKITEKAATEGRSFTAEEKEQFDRMLAEEKSLRSTIEAVEAQEGLEVSLNEQTEQRNRQAHVPGNQTPEERHNAQFDQHLRSKGRSEYELRDNSMSSGGSGDYIVPTGFYSLLVAAMRFIGGPMNVATVINSETGIDLPVPTTDNTSSKSAATAELATISNTDRVFGQKTLKAYKYPSQVTLSNELLSDNGVNIQAILADLLAQDIMDGLNDDLTNGDGDAKPTGFLGQATSHAAAAAASISYADLVDMKYATNKAYRTNAKWMLNDTTFGAVVKLADDNNRPLILSAVVNGADETLLGQPVQINNAMPDIGASKKSVAYGAWSKYFYRQVKTISFKVSEHAAFSKDGIVFRASLRADGALAIAKAITVLAHPAS